jgi:hypothetical protein
MRSSLFAVSLFAVESVYRRVVRNGRGRGDSNSASLLRISFRNKRDGHGGSATTRVLVGEQTGRLVPRRETNGQMGPRDAAKPRSTENTGERRSKRDSWPGHIA